MDLVAENHNFGLRWPEPKPNCHPHKRTTRRVSPVRQRVKSRCKFAVCRLRISIVFWSFDIAKYSVHSRFWWNMTRFAHCRLSNGMFQLTTKESTQELSLHSNGLRSVKMVPVQGTSRRLIRQQNTIPWYAFARVKKIYYIPSTSIELLKQRENSSAEIVCGR